MAFNPLQTYHTVVDLDGNVFAFQSGVYYDKYNNSYTALPPSKGGYAAPTDQTLVASMTGGTITGTTIDSSPLGGTTPAAAHFTTVGATGQITSTLAIGTAPFVITSTTNVPNLNASSLSGATFAAPGAIGGTTPGAITVTSQNGGQIAGFRNKLRNGNMNVAQRGTTYALTTALAYGSLDGYVANQAGTAAGIFNQSAGPANGGIQNYAKLGRTAASAQLGAYLAQQALMTADSIPLAGQTVTLSFVAYAGANFSGTAFNANVYTGTGSDQSAATMQAWTGVANPATVAQAITTTPTRYSVTGTIAAAATQIGISFGYTPVGTASGDDNVYFSNVQLEVSPVATPFETRSDAIEDLICRYHLKIFPAFVGVTALPITILATMRATPTVSANGAPAGFASTNTSAEAIIISQTTAALQTITATAEL
jgi:hypothetical protein